MSKSSCDGDDAFGVMICFLLFGILIFISVPIAYSLYTNQQEKIDKLQLELVERKEADFVIVGENKINFVLRKKNSE